MKSKKKVLVFVLAICILAAGFFIWRGLGSSHGVSSDPNTEQEAEAVGVDGDVEIIVPEGQESDGF